MTTCICECHHTPHPPRPCPACAPDCVVGKLFEEARVPLAADSWHHVHAVQYPASMTTSAFETIKEAVYAAVLPLIEEGTEAGAVQQRARDAAQATLPAGWRVGIIRHHISENGKVTIELSVAPPLDKVEVIISVARSER